MKTIKNVLFWTGFLISSHSAIAKDAVIADLSFLSGCWELNEKGNITEERWGTSAGNMMLGTSKSISKEIVQQYEFLRIAMSPDSKIIYTPFINSEKATDFTLTWLEKESRIVTFENPEHDFPKRIQYWRTHADTLSVSLSGSDKLIRYALKKINCDAQR